MIYPRRRKIYQEWLGNYVGLESRAKSNQFSFNQLTAIRAIKSNQMRNYLAFIEAQIQTLSQSRMTIDAMQEYKAALAALTR